MKFMRAADGLYTNFRWGLTGEPQEMLVRDGRVAYRVQHAPPPAPSSPRRPQTGEDLDGKFLLPSFIDAHCHILPTGLDLQKLYLGNFSTKQEILDAVRDAHKTLPPEKWLL